MVKSRRKSSGANMVEFVVPVAVVAIVVGLGVYSLIDGGKMINFLVGTVNGSFDSNKKLAFNGKSVSSSTMVLAKKQVKVTPNNCILFFCATSVSGGASSVETAGASAKPNPDPVPVYTMQEIIQQLNNSSLPIAPVLAQALAPLVNPNSQISQTVDSLTQALAPVVNAAQDPAALLASILGPALNITTPVLNSLDSGSLVGGLIPDTGNLAQLLENADPQLTETILLINSLPPVNTSSSSGEDVTAQETAGTYGDPAEIERQLAEQLAKIQNKVEDASEDNKEDPNLKTLSDILDKMSAATRRDSNGLARAQQTLENTNNQLSRIYGQYFDSSGEYRGGRQKLEPDRLDQLENKLYETQDLINKHMDNINNLHGQFKGIANNDPKYAALTDKINTIVSTVNDLNNQLMNQIGELKALSTRISNATNQKGEEMKAAEPVPQPTAAPTQPPSEPTSGDPGQGSGEPDPGTTGD